MKKQRICRYFNWPFVSAVDRAGGQVGQIESGLYKYCTQFAFFVLLSIYYFLGLKKGIYVGSN